MSDDRRPVTVRRRELLAAAGAIGSVSAVGAIGSVARLTDAETFAGSVFAAGALDLEIACDSETCAVDDAGTVQFGFPDLQPGDEGSERLTLTQRGNPGWLWLVSTCPDEDLEEAITVSLGYDPGCAGAPDIVAEGTLASVLADLAHTVRLGDACLDGDGTACLTLDWAFPATPDVAQYEGASLEFELQVASVQCRHNDGTVSPLPARECTPTTTTTTTTTATPTTTTAAPSSNVTTTATPTTTTTTSTPTTTATPTTTSTTTATQTTSTTEPATTSTTSAPAGG
ncbi:MAG: hypothetical protein ABEJ59_02235 [Halanaeroarchaeum sp.]